MHLTVALVGITLTEALSGALHCGRATSLGKEWQRYFTENFPKS